MRTLSIMVAAVMLAGFSVAPAMSADVAKIGIIDFQRILDVSIQGKAAQEEINSKGKQWEATLQKKGDGIQAAQKDFERESLVMSKEQRMEKERDIRIQIGDFQKMQQEYGNAARQLQFEHIQRIRNQVEGLVVEIGKKEGFLLIIEKKEAGVVYAPDSVDITDKVIKQYDASAAKAAKSS
ncbi:MAG: OmpH family outer membrane protein [Pseudomonadota bacterium]